MDTFAQLGLADRAEEALKKFQGKEVAWPVTYLGAAGKGIGKVNIKEAVPEKVAGETVEKTNSFVVFVWDETHLAAWKLLQPHTKVTCRGTIDLILTGTRSGGSWFITVGLKNVRPQG